MFKMLFLILLIVMGSSTLMGASQRRTRQNSPITQRAIIVPGGNNPERTHQAWWSPKDEFATEGLNFTEEKLQKKIAFIRQNIMNGSLAPADKEQVLKAFDLIADTPRGKDLLKLTHPMIVFSKAKIYWLSEGFINGKRAFLADRLFKAINQTSLSEPGGKGKLLHLAGMMAELMTYSSHFVNRMHWKGISIREMFINEKIARLHALLENVTVQEQIMQKEEFSDASLDPMASFYRRILKMCLDYGKLPKNQAEKTARSIFIKAIWRNRTKWKVFDQEVRASEKAFQEWHQNKNRMIFEAIRDDIKYFSKRPQLVDVGIVPLLKRFIAMMNAEGDINWTYFLDPKKASFYIHPDIIFGYMDKIKDHEIHTLKVGYMFKVFNNDGTIHRMIMDLGNTRGDDTQKTTVEYYFGTKKIRAVYHHTRYWVQDYKELDQSGETLCSFRFRHNKPEGLGFLTENGKIVERYFRNGCPVKLTMKLIESVNKKQYLKEFHIKITPELIEKINKENNEK